jgi:hypothetical protein
VGAEYKLGLFGSRYGVRHHARRITPQLGIVDLTSAFLVHPSRASEWHRRPGHYAIAPGPRQEYPGPPSLRRDQKTPVQELLQQRLENWKHRDRTTLTAWMMRQRVSEHARIEEEHVQEVVGLVCLRDVTSRYTWYRSDNPRGERGCL